MRATRPRPSSTDRGPLPETPPASRRRSRTPDVGGSRRTVGRLSVGAATTALAVLGAGSTAHAAPPAPCGGVPQITDARGDGHHANSDVTAAWFTEAAGRLQAVIQVDVADWRPAHDDAASAGLALLWRAGGLVRYVRVQTFPSAPPQYDAGTWTRQGGFRSQGPTTGSVTPDVGGAATIDVPASAGATPGSTLAAPFVLTYDGGTATEPHWVDRAPGGTSPDTTETGADVVVGSCGATAPGAGGGAADPGTAGPPAGPTAATTPTTSVAVTARRLLVGGGTATVSGRATPGRAGVPVAVAVTDTRGRRRTVRTSTRASGAWSLRTPILESSTVKATVEGVSSETRTVVVRSTVRLLRVTRRPGGRVVLTGRVAPRLPGRVLLLRSDTVRTQGSARPRRGRFAIRLTSPTAGRYRAVFIPTGERAERSTSNTKSIR